MEIRSLQNTSLTRIHQAFSAAFADYVEPFTLSADELQQMLERRGFNAALSFGAFQDDEIVGFTLNGVGNWNGVLTAYDTGTGVRRDFRKRGIASRIFEKSLEPLRDAGIRQYLLEVIRSNRKAFDLYRKTGFRVTREFDYWVGDTRGLKRSDKILPAGCSLESLTNPDWAGLETLWDDPPSWQNSIESLNRMSSRLLLVAVRSEGVIVAYGCMEKTTGDLPQLAVHRNFRRRGLATAVLNRLLAETQAPQLRVINTEVNSVTVRGFLSALGLEPGPGQYEMIREI